MADSPKLDDNSAKPGGVIVLQGPFVNKHKTQVLELIRTTACLSFLLNEADQIDSITEEPERMIVETSTKSLARRIGERICAVCGGSVIPHRESQGSHFTWMRSCDR